MIHNMVYGFGEGGSSGVPASAIKHRKNLLAENWNNGSLSLTIQGITDSSVLFVGPTSDYVDIYNASGIMCSSFTTNTVVFSCEETPEYDLTVNIFVVDGSTTGESEHEEVPEGNIYGVYWDGSSNSSMLRTDDSALFSDPSPAVSNGNGSSPFDNILPWSGMERINDSEAGVLVSIPKFWYKWTRDDQVTGDMKLQIANYAADGFLVSPAHADRGDGSGERDVVYVGAYHCSSGYKSVSGVAPKVTMTRASFRTNIHNLGSTIWQWDFAMYWTICMLYLVEYADWNSQAKIGYGGGNGSSVENNGLTDSMTYHTGTNAASRTTYGHVRYRYIEDLWSNVVDWCDGIYFSDSTVYGINNPANFSDSSGGTNIGTRATNSDCIKKWTNPSASGFEYALYPSATVSDSNYATYICDHCGYNSSGVLLFVGGYYTQSQGHGLFYIYGSYGAAVSSGYIGSRLIKLP